MPLTFCNSFILYIILVKPPKILYNLKHNYITVNIHLVFMDPVPEQEVIL